MKESPILFSAPMVKAILDGSKTMTRRILKPQPFGRTKQVPGIDKFFYRKDLKMWWGVPNHIEEFDPSPSTLFEIKCPYEGKDNLLWVREKWAATRLYDLLPPSKIPLETDCHGLTNIFYYQRDCKKSGITRWRPSIHMPKKFCRIWLKVKDIRVERLQDITVLEAIKEGVPRPWGHPYVEFTILWDSINGKPRKDGVDISWAANPWVWVIEFEKTIKPNSTK